MIALTKCRQRSGPELERAYDEKDAAESFAGI